MNAEDVLSNALYEHGFVCTGCGEFFEGLKYNPALARTGCPSNKQGLHTLYVTVPVMDVDFGEIRLDGLDEDVELLPLGEEQA